MSGDPHPQRIRKAVLETVRAHSQQPLSQPLQAASRRAQRALEYVYWLADHFAGFSTVRVFLDELKSDVVGILYAVELELERTAYLHARSLLENLVRHCYYDTRPAVFVAEQLDASGPPRRKWSDLVLELRRLPHFAAASAYEPDLFADLNDVYVEACRFVHAPGVPRLRSATKGIRSVGITEDRAKQLAAFLGRVCDVTSLMLVLYHLGPYLLIAQPVRTYLLKSMQPGGRKRFLGCLERVSLGWARHQRDAALVALRGRRQKVRLGREGLRSEGPSAVIVEPE